MALQDDLNNQQSILGGLMGQQSQFNGVNDASTLKAKYGIQDVGETYAPLFKMLAQNNAKNMRGAQLRAGGRSASPGETFSDTQRNNENGFQGLLGSEGEAKVNQGNSIAQMLQQSLGAQDAFNSNKYAQGGNMANNIFGNQLRSNQWDAKQQGPSGWAIGAELLKDASNPLGQYLGRH
jgi:hypothetical protein